MPGRYMPFRNLMRIVLYLAFLAFLSCSSGSQKKTTQVDTTKSVAIVDTTQQKEEPEVDFRQQFVSLYQKPITIDTSFIEGGKIYKIVFHHYSTMDNGLVVPAKYNFDIKKDFVTHNFVSDLTVLLQQDTIFKKHITKSTFNTLLDTITTPLKKYATLLYPTLSIKDDRIKIHYSISIPVTDVGIGVEITFDKKGSYEINGM
jgi:hypothetical protein